MQPKLMDINDFIRKKRIKQVSTTRRYTTGDKIDVNGPFSEDIFGRLGSTERRTRFGYIDLKTKVIHPEAWNIVTRISPDFLKCIKAQNSYVLTNEKILVEDESGGDGLVFFISVLPKLNLDYYAKKDSAKKKLVDFTKKNIKLVLTDKLLVLPAGIRDITISKTSGKTLIQSSDINRLYDTLINQTNSIATTIENLPKDIAEPIVSSIQRNVIEISAWIKNRIKGKSGLIRGGMFKKVTDYSGRLVVTGDPELKLGYIGLPWQTILKLFEPFTINHILYKDKTSIPLVQEELKIETVPDTMDIKRLIKKCSDNPRGILPELRENLIEIAKEITREKVVIYKRDPVENRDSWMSAYVRVDEDGFVVKVNPMDLPRTGGDCDGDQFVIYSLLTNEAQEEAKQKMNPRHNKSMWKKVTNSDQLWYGVDTHDAATAIFAATKQ